MKSCSTSSRHIERNSNVHDSPLARIRQAETEASRRIAAARAAAEAQAQAAEAQAAALQEEAQAAGRREGEARYRKLVAEAEEEAQAIRVRAQHDAEALRRSGEQRMEEAIRFALDLVLDGSDESPQSVEGER